MSAVETVYWGVGGGGLIKYQCKENTELLKGYRGQTPKIMTDLLHSSIELSTLFLFTLLSKKKSSGTVESLRENEAVQLHWLQHGACLHIMASRNEHLQGMPRNLIQSIWTLLASTSAASSHTLFFIL